MPSAMACLAAARRRSWSSGVFGVQLLAHGHLPGADLVEAGGVVLVDEELLELAEGGHDALGDGLPGGGAQAVLVVGRVRRPAPGPWASARRRPGRSRRGSTRRRRTA